MSDLIKREDAIKAMEQRYEDILRTFKRKVKIGEKAIVLDMIGCVKNLPSADRPQGKWIRDRYWSRGVGMGEEYGFFYKCSMCEYEVESGYTRCGFNYCPYCGCRMKGADDE